MLTAVNSSSVAIVTIKASELEDQQATPASAVAFVVAVEGPYRH